MTLKSCKQNRAGDRSKTTLPATPFQGWFRHDLACTMFCTIFFEAPPNLALHPATAAAALASVGSSIIMSSSITNANIAVLMTAAAVGLFLLLEANRRALEKAVLATLVIPSIKRRRLNSIRAEHRRSRKRRTWSVFRDDLSDRQFRRYFRMSKDVFLNLCRRIEDIVGAHEFKSEEYLDNIISNPHTDPSNNIYFAHERTTGGALSGEVKLAATLRILGGGTYMDMALLYNTSFNHMHKIFGYVVERWLRHPSFYNIDGVAYCSDDTKMRQVALEFARGSQGVINGCIGALDGWVVKIRKPKRSDGVRNAASFYSRKGYFSINVQAEAGSVSQYYVAWSRT